MPDVPGTVNYPTSLDSVISLFETANGARTNLTGDSGSSTLSVYDTSLFPNSGALSVENEIIYYTGKTATTFTGCVRGREGTTAVAHGGNAAVEQRITARQHSALADAIVALEMTLGSSIRAVETYGAVGNGVTDDTAAIQAAIDALPATGGIVQFGAKVYVVNGTISVLDRQCVVLRGNGAEHTTIYASSPTKGTVLKRVSGTGTMISVGSVSAARSVSGIGVESLSIDGGNLATIGLLITSVYGGGFRDLHIRNCTTVAIDVTTVDLTNTEDTQNCIFERLTIRQIESASGIGMRLGSGAAGLGNTSLNSFNDILVTHKNGVGIQVNDTDSNRFVGLNTNQSGGTGIGVELGASNHASSGHARYNTFLFLGTQAGGITARATGFTKPSQNNIIFGYSRGNSAPLPTIEPNATLFFTTDTGLLNVPMHHDFRIGNFIKDDFQGGSLGSGAIGELGWSLSGGTLTAPAALANHPGILNMDTTATINTIMFIRTGAASNTAVLATDLFDVIFLIRLNVNDTNTATRFGISNSPNTAPPSSGVYIEKDFADTSWFGVARNGGTQSRTAALATVTTGWIKLRVRRVDASNVGFSVDDGAEVTLNTNIPTSGMSPYCQITNNAAASKTVDIDYFEMTVSGMTR
jgi:hypothetical protein